MVEGEDSRRRKMRQGVGRKDISREDTFNLAANAEAFLDAAPPVRLLPKCLSSSLEPKADK